jgi:hypothetical protein
VRGWSEHFVRWQLPPWRGHHYLHADHIAEGEEVTWLETEEDDPDLDLYRALKARWCPSG